MWPRLKDRVATHARWLWCHRTKAAGILMGMGASIQSALAQYGHYISPKWQGILLGIAGMITFLIGLYNTFSGL